MHGTADIARVMLDFDVLLTCNPVQVTINVADMSSYNSIWQPGAHNVDVAEVMFALLYLLLAT